MSGAPGGQAGLSYRMLAFIETVPVLPDVLAGAGLGVLTGAIVAQRHERQGWSLPRDWIVTRWSAFGALMLGGASLALELL